ncbi:MAG: alcohol dehydrogenase catalytic domain-containing protein [Actinomycetota bacterium]|nr:alcohol dehydrogenase catalytic domain-containing protein [Actinomycetota bacterium]
MKAAVLGPDGLTIETVPDPTPLPDQLVLHTSCAGTCGSDLNAGLFLPHGSVLGHEFSGHIVHVGRDAGSHWRAGQLVTALPALGCGRCAACAGNDPVHCASVRYVGLDAPGGFAEYVAVGGREARLLPDGVNAELGALVEPPAIGLHQLNSAGPVEGKLVVVIGCGPIGLAAVLWAKVFGARAVVASDPVASRRAAAVRAGAELAIDPGADDLATVLRDRFSARADIVVECAGDLIPEAIRIVRRGGTVVVAAMSKRPVGFETKFAHMREVAMVFPSWYHGDEWTTTIDALASGLIEPQWMISHRVGLHDFPQAYADLKQPTDQSKVMIDFTIA